MTTDQVVTDLAHPVRLLLNRLVHTFGRDLKSALSTPRPIPIGINLPVRIRDFTVFHSSAWMRVLSKTYGHKALVLTWCRNGEVAAALPLLEVASPLTGRRGVSLPFTDFCKPLFFSECDPSMILEDVRTFAPKTRLEAL